MVKKSEKSMNMLRKGTEDIKIPKFNSRDENHIGCD